MPVNPKISLDFWIADIGIFKKKKNDKNNNRCSKAGRNEFEFDPLKRVKYRTLIQWCESYIQWYCPILENGCHCQRQSVCFDFPSRCFKIAKIIPDERQRLPRYFHFNVNLEHFQQIMHAFSVQILSFAAVHRPVQTPRVSAAHMGSKFSSVQRWRKFVSAASTIPSKDDK